MWRILSAAHPGQSVSTHLGSLLSVVNLRPPPSPAPGLTQYNNKSIITASLTHMRPRPSPQHSAAKQRSVALGDNELTCEQ